ncbi:hypothetical protein AWC38_SpisGene17394 [Stylophora pistillata]|uniref:Uncharacterized protein n=1 Tax=Stylophora pistillata TaxID=50429 RepID=A0A2B4RPT4_STYPI|nr:hypothetical protein AWC38_SpisGene17394 [Stylophora pistillata]
MIEFALVIKGMKSAYDAAKQQDKLSDEDASANSEVTEANENVKNNDPDGKTGEGLIDDLMFEDILAEIEAAIHHLPDDSKDTVRTSSAAILHRARLPAHNKVSKEERKALNNLTSLDQSRVVMKADKGNCFVVMDRPDHDSKMETLFHDRSTNEVVPASPFCRIEHELNAMLLSLKRQLKIDEPTYHKHHSTDGTPPAIHILLSTIKKGTH